MPTPYAPEEAIEVPGLLVPIVVPDSTTAAKSPVARMQYGWQLLTGNGITDPSTRQVIGGLGEAESRYGIIVPWLRALPDGTHWARSWNFGATVGLGDADHVVVTDHDANGKEIKVQFQAWSHPSKGLHGFLERWLGNATNAAKMTAAASAGDVREVARLMYARGYYTGTKGTADDRINAYARMLYGAGAAFAKANGEKLALQAPPGATPPPPVVTPPTPPPTTTAQPVASSSSTSGGGAGAVAAAFVVGALLLLRK